MFVHGVLQLDRSVDPGSPGTPTADVALTASNEAALMTYPPTSTYNQTNTGTGITNLTSSIHSVQSRSLFALFSGHPCSFFVLDSDFPDITVDFRQTDRNARDRKKQKNRANSDVVAKHKDVATT